MAASARQPSPAGIGSLVYRAEARLRFGRAKAGGPDRDRTGDLLNAIQARSQLRYRPMVECGTLNRSLRPEPRQPRQLGTRVRLHRRTGGRCLTTMGQREPGGQTAGGFLGCRAVEGHHRGRHARRAPELCPPPGTNRCDFNLMRPAADVLFELMNVHGSGWKRRWSSDSTRVTRGVKRSPARRQRARLQFFHSSHDFHRRKFELSASSQVLHHPCTAFPQRSSKSRLRNPVERVELGV